MGWWEIITDRGRSVASIVVRFDGRELRVSAYGLAPGERPAVLIDHLKSHAYFFDDCGRCERLLSEHGYEGVNGGRSKTGRHIRGHDRTGKAFFGAGNFSPLGPFREHDPPHLWSRTGRVEDRKAGNAVP